MDKSADLLPGTLDMLILKAVSLKPLHGYGILQRIYQISDDALQIPQGSLYPAVYRLEHQQLIAAEWGVSENNRRAKYYTLTPAGRKRLREETAGWNRLASAISAALNAKPKRCDVWTRIQSVLRVLKTRHDFEAQMSEELQFHIQQYSEDLIRSAYRGRKRTPRSYRVRWPQWYPGRLPAGARPSTVRRTAQAGPSCRAPAQQNPQFTATALVTLAVCLGANLTIFAVIDSILLRPLPFPHADRLVTVYNTYPKAGVDRDGSSITNYYERRGRIPAFTSLALFSEDTAVVGDVGSTERAHIAKVSPEFFATLESGPVLGRSLREDETSDQTDKVVILTDAYWRANLNATPDVLDRRIRVDGVPYTVIGVLPPDFRFLCPQRGCTSRSPPARKIVVPSRGIRVAIPNTSSPA